MSHGTAVASLIAGGDGIGMAGVAERPPHASRYSGC